MGAQNFNFASKFPDMGNFQPHIFFIFVRKFFDSEHLQTG